MIQRALFIVLLLISCSSRSTTQQSDAPYDVVVYGGTSAGIVTALQVIRMGGTVALIEPGQRIGGLTTGGLGQTDIGNKQAIGGISREFYKQIRRYYNDPAHWNWQEANDYQDGGQTRTEETEQTMWTFEPSAALAVFEQMLEEAGISVIYQEKLDRQDGVVKENGRIQSITMESGRTFKGRMFIDATYEGDLMAASGITYSLGRESNETYGESLNGVQPNKISLSLKNGISINGRNHNFISGVDPYVVPGHPESGLLPYISPHGPGIEGAADKKIQAYCFRMTLTDHPDNRIPFFKPDGYEEKNYELLLRNYEAGYNDIPWINSSMPNRKTDTNNKDGFSTDFIGQNYDYPEASYEERALLVDAHRTYQQGLMWTLANHPRIPEKIRKEVSRWGTCKDEYAREDGWQEQLYIREARRMISEVVMTQRHCEGLEVVEDAVGLGAYGMDSHHIQRYVDANGYVSNEGNVQSQVAGPYPISYRSIIPKKQECENLLVPVCLSASHIAFGSIRMEPVFMVLGQSAATAAVLSIKMQTSVQDLDYQELRVRLLEDGQHLK